MALPETDLGLIRRFCEEQVPPEFLDRVRIEFRVRGLTVTIVECRPAWGPEPTSEWIELPQARMKYSSQTQG